MIQEADMLNFVKDLSLAVLMVFALWRLTGAGIQFMEKRALADERRSAADDALMGRLLQSSEQQVEINSRHAEFQAGILKSMSELSHQILAATSTISAFTTSTTKALVGVIEAVNDGNKTLEQAFSASLDEKTDLALRTIERVQATADAINAGQTTMQESIGQIAQRIIEIAEQIRRVQEIEARRETSDEEFRDYLKDTLVSLSNQLSSAEQTLVALSNQSIDDKAESAGKETDDETLDGVGVDAVVADAG